MKNNVDAAVATLSALKTEIRLREKAARKISRLMNKRDRLAESLGDINLQLSRVSVDGTEKAKRGPKVGSRRKVKKDGQASLKTHLMIALKGSDGQKIADLVTAVQDAGYTSSSQNFRLLVNQTLLNEGEFKKVGRGEYMLSKKGQKVVGA